MDYIDNRTFEEIAIGDAATISRTLTRDDILLFAAVSGDVNPAHVDEEFARSDMFHEIIAHGMWGAALISTVLGTELPGPGTIYVGQTLRFRRPVRVGDVITVTVAATEKIAEKGRVIFDCQCTNQNGEVVISGTAEVIAPKEKISRPRMVLPEVRLFDRYARFRELIRRVEPLDPIRAAIVHPVDKETLVGCIEAVKDDLIIPILVGPERKIQAVAEMENIDISRYELVPVEHSHAAAQKAVALARSGQVDLIMKGTLATEELMSAVESSTSGIRTGRRLSHVFALDVPTYARSLFLTDAELNVYPRIEDKRDIVQNAVDLLHAVGIDQPKVALLSAVERIDPRIESTTDAAALCKMAERGQITGALLDGPMPFDTAISEEAAIRKGIQSAVAGKADILVVPDLESGQMLIKQLQYLVDAQVAGLVLGARAPVILPGPEDTARSREAACALALLLVHARRRAELIEKPGLRPLPLP
jgi:phosphate acetyltransferase/phosphate butyryltransferase